MADIWLKSKEVAELENIDLRTAHRRCLVQEYVTKKVTSPRGKESYLILLESLPAKAQQRYHEKNIKNCFETKLKDIPEKKRAIALARFRVISGESPAPGIAPRTLARWKSVFDRNGIAGLVPGWKNGRNVFDPDYFSPEAREFAEQYYLHQNRPSVAAVYYELEKEALRNRWEIPSYWTVRRHLSGLPAGARILEREGKKSFNDKVIPSMIRDIRSLRINQIWVSDHHQINIATIIKEGKADRVIFPWISAWMDMRSKKVTGWVLSSQPNQDTVNLSLRDGIMRFGLPEEAYIDNGKDYWSKMFMGGLRRFKLELNQGIIGGIYADLGIKPHFAIPYNPQAKPIERLFRRFDDQFAVHFRGYRGKDIRSRPEKLKTDIKKGNLISFEELKEKIHGWLELHYSRRPHRSLGMRCPDEVLAKSDWVKRSIKEDELVLLMSAYPRLRRVGREGIWFMEGYYWGEDIIPYFGRKVWVRYSENDWSKIFLMNEQGVYIGIARRRHLATFDMSDKDYEHYNRMKKKVREAYKGFLGKPLPDEERERIASSPYPGNEEIVQPKKDEIYVKTRYGMMLEDARKKEMENKIDREQIDRFDRKWAAMEIPRRDIEAEADRWALNYGRDYIDAITKKCTND